MAAHILDVELRIELRIDLDIALVLLRPDMRELRPRALFGLCAFLGEAVDAEEFGVRVGGGPFGEEDVVLVVEGCEVAHVVA